MITDTEIKSKGVQILATHLGDVEMERFIALIQREPFDYTKWHQNLEDDISLEELSRKAMSLRHKTRSSTL
ncbi:MAG: hypothetical protein methR_P1973 [Methyloprofundus sp.]|nr:MAG: hypothetical protein methR_P1973 [Methyloprofundus sp.]